VFKGLIACKISNATEILVSKTKPFLAVSVITFLPTVTTIYFTRLPNITYRQKTNTFVWVSVCYTVMSVYPHKHKNSENTHILLDTVLLTPPYN
jgi:hypothetical protein